MKSKKSAPILSINGKDLLKGFVVSVLTVVVTGLVATMETGELPTWPKLKALLITGLCAGGAYLLKNLFTNSDDKLLKKEAKPAPLKPLD